MSGGGYLVLKAFAMNSQFKSIVALCPLTSPDRNPIPLEVWNEFTDMMHGISGEQLKSQYEELSPIETMAEQLRSRPVLVLTGARDEHFPPGHYGP
jgi:dipeptidyl aminopeptidase/acylaminoacyl peptidase